MSGAPVLTLIAAIGGVNLMNNMKRVLLLSWTVVALAIPAHADDQVLWDMAKTEIPAEMRSGNIEKVDGAITLRDGAAFAVPAEAFPDQKNFTVQVTVSLRELVQNAVCTVMRKQSEQDDGFALSFNYRDNPYYARQVSSFINNILMTSGGIGGSRGPQINTPYTFTLAVRNGYATFYLDDAPCKSCYMELVPNREPMWIGRNADKKSKTIPVTIHSVKVFGPSYHYVSKRESKSEFPRGAVAGRGWALDIPKIEHPEWPKVLIYGDSISGGYSRYLIAEMLKQQVYVFHCVHFVGGDVPEQALAEMAGRYKFDVAVFNNGLHSLHWTADKVPDSVVQERMRKLARCFKKGAPQAKIFYLMTTPHTGPRPAPDKPVSALGEKNDVVVRLNTLSGQIMKEEGIQVIDVYSILSKRLELASGDGYHWQGPAYQIISQEIAQLAAAVLGKGR